MLGSAGAQSQVITSLGSEAASLLNYFKNFAVSGCSSCYQKRQYSGRNMTQEKVENPGKISTEKDTIRRKNLPKDKINSPYKALYDALGLKSLPENWTDLLSPLAVRPAHIDSESVWKRSYVSASSFFENKHGFSKQLSRSNSSASRWRLFHTGSTKHLWNNTAGKVSKTLVRYIHSMDRISHLEEAANSNRDNPLAQALYLQAVVQHDPEYVIRRYESGLFASDDICRRIYLKALENTGRIGSEEYGRQPPITKQQSLHGVNESNPVIIKEIETQEESFSKEGFSTLRYILWRVLLFILIISTLEVVIDKVFRADMNKFEVLPEEADKNIRFSDVRGAIEAKQEFFEIVEFLKNPKKFQYIGGRMPAGVLLTGPPGVGKTLLAKAVAGEAGVPFFYASGSDFEEMFVGVGAARIRKLFDAAKRQSPSIVFIDEIDAIGGKRVPTDHQPYSNITMNQLLTELDGFEKDTSVIVIAATNFPQSLDPALTRPGRFDTVVTVNPPYLSERKDILQLYIDKVKAAKDVNIQSLARTTAGFTGADLANLVNQAALRAAADEEDFVHMKHFEYAKDKHFFGSERKACVLTDEMKYKVAVYEAGRALIALKNPNAVPVYKGTIIPRGRFLGHVAQAPEGDVVSLNKDQVTARIDVLLGGLAADEICFGKDQVTVGAEEDLEKATRSSRLMVTSYCMSDKVGYCTQDDTEDVSDERLQVIDEEVERILQESYERTKQILIKHKDQHQLLAQALVKYETLTQEEMKLILEGKPIKSKEV